MVAIRKKRATDEVLASHARIVQASKAISFSLDNRDERAETNPFIPVYDIEDGESLVQSIENAIELTKV